MLPNLAAGSVDCVVSSPPYFGLRDYQTHRQVGVEAGPQDYIEGLTEIFRQVRLNPEYHRLAIDRLGLTGATAPHRGTQRTSP